MTTDIAQIDDIKALISKIVSASINESEEASAITAFATTYIDIINDINIRYLDVLVQAIADIKKINNSEIGLTEKFRLGEVRRSLNL